MWPIIQVCFHGSEKPNCSIKYRLLYKVLNELANFKSKQFNKNYIELNNKSQVACCKNYYISYNFWLCSLLIMFS